jgi:trans-2,3-dihydro-3-hydroxyanthranilate isomerase
VDTRHSRRSFLQSAGAAGIAAAVGNVGGTVEHSSPGQSIRRFHCVQIDVFTSRRLEGNPLAVFTDARGLSDSEMQGLARETNLQETTFVFPRDAAIEREQGVKVRIFVPEEEIPFGGHPTLGTAVVLRNSYHTKHRSSPLNSGPEEISLDLKVGKISVSFHADANDGIFGEMHQVDPVFGQIHDRATVADLIGIKPADISDEWPVQTVSTGLPFAIVPIKRLSVLQSLQPDLKRIRGYFEKEPVVTDFYYITRDTSDTEVGLRSRAIYPNGEDPATGSAAGCTSAWMVRYGIAKPEETVHILQGVEIKRPSHIFVRASKDGDNVKNVRVGGHAVQIMEGTVSL